DANPAIDVRRGRVAARVEGAARVARVGPFPDIAGHIEESILVRTEAADGARPLVGPVLAARVPLVTGERALTGIATRVRQGIIAEPAGRRVGPFLVRGQAERHAGGA